MIDLFVNGRICLIGEHSDWTTDYIKENKKIVSGMALVCGTEEGIHAKVSKSKNIIFDDKKLFEINKDKLFEIASGNTFYAYFCAACYYMINKYNVSGIKVKVIKSDLPIKKGLSSSAAICVLVVKAYNHLYNLGLNVDDEMMCAYESERITGSKCGIMDQVCVYGNQLSFIDFNTKKIEKIKLKKDLYIVYADLNGKKNTKKILRDLNAVYPYAKDLNGKLVHFFFGLFNKHIVLKAKKYLENGNYKRLGNLYNLYQKLFDLIISKNSKELEAPLLHKYLRDKTLRKFVYGAKGIGAGGDGSIQFIVKNEKAQEELINYLTNKGLKVYKNNLKSDIRKAVLAVAGNGTRMYPYTKFIRKEFIPVVSNQMFKPIISVLLEMLYDSGINEICLGVSDYKQIRLYKNYFKKSTKYIINNVNMEYDKKLKKIWKCLKFIIIRNSKGFGHTVSIFRKFSKNEPVLLLLGDTLYNLNEDYIDKLNAVYKEYGNPIISICEKKEEEIENCGIVKGKLIEKDILEITTIKEKPKKEYAYKYLKINKKVYGVFGMYVLNKDILKHLCKVSKFSFEKEVSLTDTLEYFVLNEKVNAVMMENCSYDFGNIDEYMKNFIRVK